MLAIIWGSKVRVFWLVWSGDKGEGLLRTIFMSLCRFWGLPVRSESYLCVS